MSIKEIKKDIFYVGVADPDRKVFDELIPLPDGTSYNSYIIKGREKTVLIDTVDPVKTNVLFNNLKEINIEKIDYLVANHAEQDHSGSIPEVLARFPMAKVVTNEKCKKILIDLLMIEEERFITITDNEELSLGGKKLKFIMAPWVHWPETMLTYLIEDRILFSCDFFGSHFATDDIFVIDEKEIYSKAKRYYAEIMMPFRKSVQTNIKKVKDLDIDIIAPSHGPLYRNTDYIIDSYEQWASDNVKNEVIIPYISMHGSIKKAVEILSGFLSEKGVVVKNFDLGKTDIGELAMALVDSATVVLATPTVLAGPHPNIIYAAYLFKVLRPKTKYASVINSFSWGGKTVDQIAEIISSPKIEIIKPVEFKGYPKETDIENLKTLAGDIALKHSESDLFN